MFVAFDLDDTLYKERDFVDSAFQYIASSLAAEYGFNRDELLLALRNKDKNPFDSLMEHLAARKLSIKESVAELVDMYRYHRPRISLSPGILPLLEKLNAKNTGMAIITDGRSQTQRNKIQALGIERFFPAENILISEETGFDKHFPENFQTVMKANPAENRFVYVGDNIAKDFFHPNHLGWTTVRIADPLGLNIFQQPAVDFPADYLPDHTITLPFINFKI